MRCQSRQYSLDGRRVDRAALQLLLGCVGSARRQPLFCTMPGGDSGFFAFAFGGEILAAHYMRRCLQLAAQAQGMTSPNPLVGCVIVREGKVVGEGYHQRAGEPHAEVHALRQAGQAALGADLYVNLEPCCHFGRTPPCTEAILQAGVRRVVVGMLDPNPQVAGQGVARLQSQGVESEVGVLEADCRRLNAPFVKFITTRTPYVLWKTAASLDGRVAAAGGDARWVTGPEARAEVHSLRLALDAVVVGSGTVLADDPELTVRPLPAERQQPVRVVLDGRGRVSGSARVLAAGARVFWAVGSDADISAVQASIGGHVHVLRSPTEDIQLPWVLERLGEAGITSVLLEGGPRLATAFWQNQLVDEVRWYAAPKLIGSDGIPSVGALGYAAMARVGSLRAVSCRLVGDDICVQGYPPWSEEE